MARPQCHIAVIPLQIIHAMRNDNPWGEARKVMIPGLDGRLGIEPAGTVEIAPQLFFFVAMLKTGLPRSL
jgi:hypothetical protein